MYQAKHNSKVNHMMNSRVDGGLYADRAIQPAQVFAICHCLPVEGMKADHSTTIYARLLP